MTLSEEIVSLQRAAHELMYLGMDGSPVYSDDLSRRNGEVYRLTTALYNSGVKGSTVEEQANVCLALLMGYSASFLTIPWLMKLVPSLLPGIPHHLLPINRKLSPSSRM